MRIRASACLLFLGLAALGGCLDITQAVHLNPDGSGRLRLDASFPREALGITPVMRGDEVETILRQNAGMVLANARGVDAWSDISLGLEEETVTVGITAYFRDFRDFDLSPLPLVRFALEGQESGVLRLGLFEPRPPRPGFEATGTDVARGTHPERLMLQRSLVILRSIMGDFRHRAVFHLPGSSGTALGLESLPDGSFRLEIESGPLLQTAGRLVRNFRFIQRRVAAGRRGIDDSFYGDGDFRSDFFGDQGPPVVVATGPFAPLFDYESEVREAREEMPETARLLGLPPPGHTLPEREITLEDLRRIQQAMDIRRRETDFPALPDGPPPGTPLAGHLHGHSFPPGEAFIGRDLVFEAREREGDSPVARLVIYGVGREAAAGRREWLFRGGPGRERPRLRLEFQPDYPASGLSTLYFDGFYSLRLLLEEPLEDGFVAGSIQVFLSDLGQSRLEGVFRAAPLAGDPVEE